MCIGVFIDFCYFMYMSLETPERQQGRRDYSQPVSDVLQLLIRNTIFFFPLGFC